MNANKKSKRAIVHAALITACISIISFAMLGLYAISPLTSPMYRGGFTRNLKTNEAIIEWELNLGHNSYYIAGFDSTKIYLGNYTRPFLVTEIDKRTKRIMQRKINATPKDSIEGLGYFRLIVTSKYFYLTHGVKPIILHGTINNWVATQMQLNTHDYFDQAVPINVKSFAIRYYNNKINGYIIGKKQTKNNAPLKGNPEILNRQRDGIFSVDGKLLFCDSLNRIVYVYLYRNQFVAADTNLNVTAIGTTIDTISHANVSTAELSSGETMLSGVPTIVNRNSAISGKQLFVESNILGQGEDEAAFKRTTVVDIYSLTDRQYVGSINLKNSKNKRVSDFKTDHTWIYAICDKYLIKYTIIHNIEAK